MNKTTSSWCALFGIASANLIIYGFYVVLGINTRMKPIAQISPNPAESEPFRYISFQKLLLYYHDFEYIH